VEPIRVAAGILWDSSGRVLVTERLGDSPFAGLWEFPGGKIRAGESAPAALRRELSEELDVAIDVFEHFLNVDHRYSDRHVCISFYLITGWRSEPKSMEGQALRWVHPEWLRSDEVLPADLPVLTALQNRSVVLRKY
jgi:8-oxo-dGTP diphosphatase